MHESMNPLVSEPNSLLIQEFVHRIKDAESPMNERVGECERLIELMNKRNEINEFIHKMQTDDMQ